MKSFYHVNYRFYRADQPEHTIFAISDIHFSGEKSAALDRLAETAEQLHPALITISGDLIDNLDAIDAIHQTQTLEAWLTRLGKIAPVCLCLGNHDFYRKSKATGHYVAERNDSYLQLIRSIDNIHLLDDSSFETNDFYVFGLTLPPTYYCFDKTTEKTNNLLSPKTEDINILLEKLDELSDYTTKLPNHKTKIALIHSPVHLLDEQVQAKLEEFDFILAGHMHNGIVPPLLDEVWRSHRGIITPSKHFFKDHNTRTGLYGNKLIVLGAVTTIAKGAKPFGFLNRTYPVNYATIETTKNDTFARKPDIHKKYEKWS